MQQGTGAYQRVGNQITLKGVHEKGMLFNNSTKTVFVRQVIGWLKTEEALGSTTAIFRGTAGEAVAPSSLAAPYHAVYFPFHPAHFKPVYDKVHRLEGVDATTAGNRNYAFFNCFKRFNTKIKFTSTDVSLTMKPRLISIFFAATADADDGTGFIVELSRITREFFTDA